MSRLVKPVLSRIKRQRAAAASEAAAASVKSSKEAPSADGDASVKQSKKTKS